ncbi:hypothetical protein EJB05_47190, partial [Eragrostis curvula]
MEEPPPPPDPISPSAEGSPGGGAEDGGFSAGLEPLWSILFGDPPLEPMWSPPREFGVGEEFAGPEAEVDDAGGGPWDGAPWRSTGVVPDERPATPPVPAVGFPGSETASPGAVLEVRPLQSIPDSSSSPVEECASEPIACTELVPSASSAENLGEMMLMCTLNSVPSPPPSPSPDNLDLEAEEAPKDGCSPEKIAAGAMVVIALDAKGGLADNAGCSTLPDVGTSPRRSLRLAKLKVKAAATFPDRKVGFSRSSKHRLSNKDWAITVSTSSIKDTAITAVEPFDPPSGMERHGSRKITATQTSSINRSQKGDVVVALPVVTERSRNSKIVRSSGKTRPAPKVMGTKIPLELEETSSQPPKSKRVRIASGKCLSNLKRAQHITSSMCELSVVTMTSDPNNKPKTILDNCSTESGMEIDGSCFFTGEPVPAEESKHRWPHRYESNHHPPKKDKRGNIQTFSKAGEAIFDVKCHYLQANICGSILCIGDCAFIKVMHEQAQSHDRMRLFYSELKDDNLLDCIVSKVTVVQVSPSDIGKSKLIPSFDYYYDMKYSLDYSTFSTMVMGSQNAGDTIGTLQSHYTNKKQKSPAAETTELSLLDLYCGCGGMSTGLCLGARGGGVNLVARWAVDGDEIACESFRLNHPKTQVRNETTEDFLELLKEWEKLCKTYVKLRRKVKAHSDVSTESSNETSVSPGEFEVSKLVDVCFGDPNSAGKRGLYFKVRWKGYGPDDDTWEPIEGLKKCKEAIGDFVIDGQRQKILPLPDGVDVICGGPPCQGISGYNRNREFEEPFKCERNKQIIVFMDVIQFLKPKYIYMENVLDILKFADATLARYALSRLVAMHYQAKLGIMAAGCYGLPQFRMRVFLLGCHPNEKLPPFPLPTHEAVVKNGCPLAFERNLVGWPEGALMQLEKPIVLEDVLPDLPEVTNGESRDEMLYVKGPQTEFQRYIRSFVSAHAVKDSELKLYDHRPTTLDNDNHIRVSKIPKKKGANFRDLPGVIVGPDNVARLDPTKERELLPSGRPLVLDCTLSYENGKSLRPYGRLWWDEVVGTVLTCPNARMQALIHPAQDRLLTIRESARLQGFPDSFRFHGTVKDRYRQIGNAVAIPVGRALGYALSMAYLNKTGDNPLMVLPPKFAFSNDVQGRSCSNGLQNDQS